MQLSAPTLSIDPSTGSAPDSAGIQTGTVKGAGDFGAILAAESRHKPAASSSLRANRPPSPEKSTVSSNKKQAADDFPTERRPGRSSLDQSKEADPSIVAEESRAAAAGVVVATPSVAVAETVDAELELSLANGFSQVQATHSDSTSEADASYSSDTRMARLGGMLVGKSQSADHAFGLTLPGSAAQSSSNGPAISVARVPAALAGTTLTPTSTSDQAPPVLPAALSGSATVADILANMEQRAAASGSFADASPISTAGSDPDGKGIDSLLGESVSLEQPLAELSEESGLYSAPGHTQERESTISREARDVGADAIDPVADFQRAAVSSAIAEKIAAHRSRVAEAVSRSAENTQRMTLVTNPKSVETSNGRIGINAAKSEAHMPATALNQTPASLAMENPSFQVNPLSLDTLIKDGAGEATTGQVAFAARRAVESVLSIADQTASTDQRTVRLQFTVGGEELAVRVELRGERVHTTFRTDSPDLRIALAHEWQSVSAVQSGVRGQRLADPVFASASSSGNGMSSDSGAAYQRDSSARHPHASAEGIFGLRRASSNTPAAAAIATASAAVVTPSNSNRLHTFA